MNNSIFAVDIGFGSTKVSFKKENGQIHYEKFTTAIAAIDEVEYLNDDNMFHFEGKGYYLFDAALKMRTSSLIDLMSYEGLRMASPIILRYLLNHYKITPDKIVLGISLAMMDRSLDYKNYVSKSLNLDKDLIKLVPQGIGAKVAYGSYSLDPSKPNTDNRSSNYIGVDIGFNTVDVFKVVNNAVSSQSTDGLEKEGVSKAASNLVDIVNSKNFITIDLQEAKSILQSGTIVKRGSLVELHEEVKQVVLEYTMNLVKLIEENYKEDIDKMDNILMVGGGAGIVRQYYDLVKEEVEKVYKKDFLIIPQLPEYYNVLGYYIIGQNELLKTAKNEE